MHSRFNAEAQGSAHAHHTAPPRPSGAGHDGPPASAPDIGHNSKGAQMPKDESGNAPSWATPSQLSLDEAAKASVGPGRYAEQRRVLIEAILDPRLGISPLPLMLLAAVIECVNGGTGMAYPGNRRLAERIVSYVNGLPAEYRYGAIRNAATVVRQAGYLVSGTRAAERGGRAIAHFALTCPTPEEREAAIEAWCREKQAAERPSPRTKTRPDVTRTMTSEADVTPPMTSPDVTPGMTPGGLMSSVDEGCCHPTGEKIGPTHYTEPGKRNPKSSNGADAPPLPIEEQAVAIYNEAARQHGFTECSTLTDARRKRLGKRLRGIGGIDAFQRALSVIHLDDFLMGRVHKAGRPPFKLTLDHLLQTDGNMGDVLAQQLDKAIEARPLGLEAEVQRCAASPIGKTLIEKLGLDKGMFEIREVVVQKRKERGVD